jgi:large subunit ribosomal protein L25
MAEINVTADTGRPTGSRAAGRMRGEGKVPAVVYGLGKEPVSVAVGWRELRVALTGEAGINTLIDLHVDGGSELVMVKDLQRHPVRRDVLHVDFLRVSRDQELTVDVPVTLVGEAKAVLDAGGVVDQVLFALAVTSKPQNIPNELTVDVSALKLGDTIRVGEIELPPDVTVHLDAEEAVVSTSAGAEVGEIEVPEGEEPAEGEEGAAEGEGAEGDSEGGSEGASSSGDAEGGDAE